MTRGGIELELKATVHREDGSYWAEIPELPGCFGAGETLDELFESLAEGVSLYLADDANPEGARPGGPLEVRSAVLADGKAR